MTKYTGIMKQNNYTETRTCSCAKKSGIHKIPQN